MLSIIDLSLKDRTAIPRTPKQGYSGSTLAAFMIDTLRLMKFSSPLEL